jgi:hypothetical protein
LELDVRGRRFALERHEIDLIAALARAQASRSSRDRDLALLLDGARTKGPIVLQRGDERTLARLLRDRSDLPRGLMTLRDAVTTS